MEMYNLLIFFYRLSPEKETLNSIVNRSDMTQNERKFEAEEEPAESLYVNVSKHAAYSRSTIKQNAPSEPT